MGISNPGGIVGLSTKETALDRTTEGYKVGQALVKARGIYWKPEGRYVVDMVWQFCLRLEKLDLASRKDLSATYQNTNHILGDMEAYFKLVRKSRKGL